MSKRGARSKSAVREKPVVSEKSARGPAVRNEPRGSKAAAPPAKRDTRRLSTKDSEILRTAVEKAAIETLWPKLPRNGVRKPPKNYKYVEELAHLQYELIKLQEWVRTRGLKVAVIFEGRDAAGKGGVIKRISEPLNPRICRVVALGTPTERERGQWYFQRYVAVLPAAGEIVLFDRSWYNRAGVERVMGFCSEREHRDFLRACPQFEEMLIRSGLILIKYWFSVSDAEQEKRFVERARNPFKRWKLSPMDLESRARWVDYSKAKDEMFAHTDTKTSPWHVVDADNKKRARLNCIAHFLAQIPYGHVQPSQVELPPRQLDDGYRRPKKSSQRFVPALY
ncbi:polyphosphate kinase 2 [Rhodoplanes roseus]|uniref:ADP/GDP-polyphosphate phosphotransferase n=1 Tax=Rhodoplanes roseus TaxID=29409 RepID=A0A327LD77_9BRAD|nr:polyphosphate kinase 2 [Rhodoplanes roseus]RAI45768.1 polyphosphate kinase 2 [Rhodoplanes roseus]